MKSKPNPKNRDYFCSILGGGTKPVRTSASTASLQLGSRFSNDFDRSESIENDGGCSMSDTPNQSPRILITRACSEESQGYESPLLKKQFSTAASAPVSQICESINKKIILIIIFIYASSTIIISP